MTLLVALLALLVAVPLAPATRLEILNAAPSGYIEAIVNGKELTKTFEAVQPGPNGVAVKVKKTTVWQAFPGQSLWITKKGMVSVALRYYDDTGRLKGMSAPRQFTLETGYGPDVDRWVFTTDDLIR